MLAPSHVNGESTRRIPTSKAAPRLWLAGAALVLLSACATPTTYQPAQSDKGYGYTETKIAEDRYRISFKGNTVTPAETTRNYALLRAGELTLQHGADWFQIVGKNTDKDERQVGGGPDVFVAPQTAVYQRCGLIRCDAVVTTTPGFVDPGMPSTTATQYTSDLTVVIGKNPMPASVESYNARELVANLRPLVYGKK